MENRPERKKVVNSQGEVCSESWIQLPTLFLPAFATDSIDKKIGTKYNRNVYSLEQCKALAKRLDFSLEFLLDKKSRKKLSRLATLLSESSGVERC